MKNTFLPTNLKTEYLSNPIGINTNSPRLSWTVQAENNDFEQTAYQIIVASSLEKLSQDVGDIFDSQKVFSTFSNQIEITGVQHKPRTQYFWKVRVWNDKNEVSDYSEPVFYETGIMDILDYQAPNRPALTAKWITFPEYETPMFRKVFEIKKEIKKARAYICGLGYYELYLNGEKVGNNVLDPAQTDYEQRAFYVTYDIKNYLSGNKNVVGIILGNGWFNQNCVWTNVMTYGKPAVILEIQIDYTDGTSEKILSDGTFKTARSPILNNNVYAGEEYDARLEIPEWQSAEFDDAGWQNAKWTVSPTLLLINQPIPPIKKIKIIKPLSVSEPQSGVFIYDMGQNFSGWVKLNIKAEKGTRVTLRFAERLHSDGTMDFTTTGSRATNIIQTLTYICKGETEETYEPRFTYFGFRYVELTGFPCEPTLENIEGVVVHSDIKSTGKFVCSDEMINRIHKAALWTQLTNLHGIPTDCPHREKCGWLGDALITAEMTIYNFDMAQFWAKYVEDIETTRRGELPQNIAPGKRLCGANPDWQVAFIIIPYFLYLYYGDIKILNNHYSGMKQLFDYLTNIAENNIINNGFGDWCEPGNIFPQNTPVALTSTAFYFYCCKMMSKIAKTIEKKDDAKYFGELSKNIKSSFINKFYDKQNCSFGSQCANSMALYLNLYPENEDKKIAEQLAKDVSEKFDFHVSTGIFGTRYIYWALAEYGYEEIALKLLTQTTPPSIGHTLNQGMTTLVERLPLSDEDLSTMTCSLNHPMSGGFTAWFYQGIGGIIADEENPAFKHFYLKPQLTKVLEFAEVEFDSPYGKIVSNWKNENANFIWNITVPENTSATVFFPTDSSEKISSKNSKIEINQNCTAKLKHGKYRFVIKR